MHKLTERIASINAEIVELETRSHKTQAVRAMIAEKSRYLGGLLDAASYVFVDGPISDSDYKEIRKLM